MKSIHGRLKLAVMVVCLHLAGPAAEAAGPTLTPLGGTDISDNFSPAFREASGLGLAKNGTKLWSVGDEENFAMYKMNLNGTPVSANEALPGNGVNAIADASFEGVTYAPPPPGITDDHFLYLVDEGLNQIVPVNYNTNRYRSPVQLADMAGYSSVDCQGGGQTVEESFVNAGNSGLEGITWNGDLSSFFVLKEKNPGLLIRISADLTTILGCQKLTYSGADYSGIAYDPDRQRFWIVSDDGASLALYDWWAAQPVKLWGLGYNGGEGVAYDPDTNKLFIVTDNGGGADSYLYAYGVQ